MENIIFIVVSFAIGYGISFLLYKAKIKLMDVQKKSLVDKDVDRILNRAKSKAAKLQKLSDLKLKEHETKAYNQMQMDLKRRQSDMDRKEKEFENFEKKQLNSFKSDEEAIDEKIEELKNKEEQLNRHNERLEGLEQKTVADKEQLKSKLESIAGMSQSQVKEELKESLKAEVEKELAPMALQIEENVKKTANDQAKVILSQAIARYASEVSSERTVSIIDLPNEDMKGRIIGKEGRNIRTFEAACGVDIIVDETPGTVVISCFDPVRREVAKQTLARLMEDGRVHPARIEELVIKVRSELFSHIKDLGEKACFEVGVYGLHHELSNLLGHLKFRTSGSQNLYEHSIEVSYIAGLLAEELGASVKSAKRAGLLHDIGLAVDYTIEGNHAEVGAKLAKKYNEKEHICEAIATHEKEVSNTLIGNIVQAANKLSQSRPGARRASIAGYISRLEDLESIGNSFSGVLKTHALQVGKEVRVIVDGGQVTDKQAQMLSSDISKKIEREMSASGQVTVNVLREIRVIGYAQ